MLLRAQRQLHHALGLAELAASTYATLSRGEKQRVDLYVALAHAPDLLILDEPCTGLDAQFTQRALELVVRHRLRGGATLMVSHSAQELKLADSLLWLDSGQVVDAGTASVLLRRHVGTGQPLLEVLRQLGDRGFRLRRAGEVVQQVVVGHLAQQRAPVVDDDHLRLLRAAGAHHLAEVGAQQRALARPAVAEGEQVRLPLDVDEVQQWGDEEYREMLRHSAIKRVKLPVLQRNARIVAENLRATPDLPSRP